MAVTDFLSDLGRALSLSLFCSLYLSVLLCGLVLHTLGHVQVIIVRGVNRDERQREREREKSRKTVTKIKISHSHYKTAATQWPQPLSAHVLLVHEPKRGSACNELGL